MVVQWVEGTFFPFIKTKRTAGDNFTVNQFVLEADDLLQVVQDFYAEVTDAVIEKNRRHLKHRKLHKSPSGGSGGGDQASLISNTDEEMSTSEEQEKPIIHVERNYDEEDEKVRQVMEQVEGTICDLFYDRYVLPQRNQVLLLNSFL